MNSRSNKMLELATSFYQVLLNDHSLINELSEDELISAYKKELICEHSVEAVSTRMHPFELAYIYLAEGHPIEDATIEGVYLKTFGSTEEPTVTRYDLNGYDIASVADITFDVEEFFISDLFVRADTLAIAAYIPYMFNL